MPADDTTRWCPLCEENAREAAATLSKYRDSERAQRAEVERLRGEMGAIQLLLVTARQFQWGSHATVHRALEIARRNAGAQEQGGAS